MRDSTTHDPESPTGLDRAWAATRPPVLSAADFERIWSEVQRAHDGAATLPMRPAPHRGRTFALITLGLAQAAAIAVAAWTLSRPVGPAAPSPMAAHPPTPTELKVDDGQTLVIRIDFGQAGRTVDASLLRPEDGRPALAFNLDVPADNHSDMLNGWEALSQ